MYRPLLKRMRLALYSVGIESLNTRDDGPEKNADAIKKHESHDMPLHWSPFVRCFIYNKHKVKFMHSPNHTEHYRK